MGLLALREAFKSLFKHVTTKYPLGPPTHVPSGLRGLPRFDEEKCTGCGACVSSCSSKAITLVNEESRRSIRIYYARCIFCGRCEEICPENAIKLTDKFELATTDKNETYIIIDRELTRCENCGKPITTVRQIERVKERILEHIDPVIRDVIDDDMKKYMRLCPDCRRKLSYKLKTNTVKFYKRGWAE